MTYQSELQNMDIDILNFIGETTTYDKKEKIERNKSKSWLKSVSAFANGEGGTLIFGISDNNEIIGLTNAEEDAEFISEAIKTKLDPIPTIDLKFKELNGKKLIFLYVNEGQETPYYYIGDKQRLAYIRIGNESVVADRIQLKQLVMKGPVVLTIAYHLHINSRTWHSPNSSPYITNACNEVLKIVNSFLGVFWMKRVN